MDDPGPVELSASLLAAEVAARGHAVTWLHRACFLTQVGEEVIGFWCARTSRVSAVAAMVTGRKDLTRRLLTAAGIAVPEGRSYFLPSMDGPPPDAFELLGPVLVVKPAEGAKGRGVTTEVRTLAELRWAIDRAQRIDRQRIVIEEHVVGQEARFLVVGARTVAVVEKRPATVVGDGSRTLEELVGFANEQRARNPHLAGRPIKLSAQRVRRLGADRFAPDGVVPVGHVLVVGESPSLSLGGHAVDITDEVHPSFQALAARVTACFPGLGVAGIDLIAEDLRAPVRDGAHVILEVNSMPGIGAHHFPSEGQRRDAASAIVEYTLVRTEAASHAPWETGQGRMR